VKESNSIIEANLVKDVEDVDVILVQYAKITKRIIKAGKNLKAIVIYGIGYDNIDVNAATENGVMLVNIPDYCVSEVSDHTIGLIFALIRKIPQASKSVKKGKWETANFLASYRLEGKTLGIIGFGKIGRSVAQKLKSLKLRVLVYSPSISKNFIEGFGLKKVSLEELLIESDIVTLHTALKKENTHLIREETLKLMKRSALIINTARGGLIKEKALYKALKEGYIAGAALDVLEKEPPDLKNPLLKLNNVVFTPHTAWSSPEALNQLELLAVEEVIRVLRGEKPKNIVNLSSDTRTN
jgi:D-3-phosphoglycerate dehydrogenase